jgi:D-glycero-D-manno-heptose 1,7-bisphosphate phosphatase
VSAARRALFLDRDGVVNVEKNYVWRIEDFEFMPGIFGLCETARKLGFLIVVITNQAGIGRGYYTEADFQHLTEWMIGEFRARGIGIDRVYHCPYHPTAGLGEYRRESFHRKPNPGMILGARDELGLDLSESVLVGDKESDIKAGIAAGLRYNVKLVPVGTAVPGKLEFATLQAIRDWLAATTASRPATPEARSEHRRGQANKDGNLP